MNALFGQYIREKREALAAERPGYSLRKVAAALQIQPSYVSKIERGEVPPPSEETIIHLAEILGEDPDVLLAMAGKVSAELRAIIMKRPKLFSDLLHQLKEAPDHAILRIAREVRDGNW
jgi:HTH-type transcriptional regulator, competence development regulator